jgi:beta-glucanase (GH16 family)
MKKFLSRFFSPRQNSLPLPTTYLSSAAAPKRAWKSKALLAAIGMLLLAANSSQAGKWTLVWSDEFNYQGLPDTNKWDYEQGFVRNHESQYYTTGRLENARVEHGHLVIEGRKEHFTPPNQAPVEYTSASLTTQTKASWEYGRIEVRAKLPRGRGTWPAIWMLGINITQAGWPACGEIDIMEFLGRETNNIHGTLHYAVNGQHQSDTSIMNTAKPYEKFHVYAIEWTPDRIDLFFDHTKYHTVFIDKAGTGFDNPFRKPQYLIINLALGGDWGGAIDDSALPQKYLIDYVRVYKAKHSQP